MRHPLTLDLMRRVTRAHVCPSGERWPHGSELLGTGEARSCEPDCPLFRHLPRLATIAIETVGRGEAPAEPGDRAIRDGVCEHCRLTPSAGEFCHDFLARTCPVSVFGGRIVALLADLTTRRHDPAPGPP